MAVVMIRALRTGAPTMSALQPRHPGRLSQLRSVITPPGGARETAWRTEVGCRAPFPESERIKFFTPGASAAKSDYRAVGLEADDAVVGLAQQFARPSGLLGAFVGRGMARGNAALSRWVVDQAADRHGPAVERIAELGPGPGVGLQALLAQFPEAHVWGVDMSTVMLSQSHKRNQAAVTAGRLTLLEGGVTALGASAPADLVMANHVLYFWPDPVSELADIYSCLRPRGLLALGYQLRRNMPTMAQKRFPVAGHRLYETEDDVTAVAVAAGFDSVVHRTKGTAAAPEGRVMLATA